MLLKQPPLKSVGGNIQELMNLVIAWSEVRYFLVENGFDPPSVRLVIWRVYPLYKSYHIQIHQAYFKDQICDLFHVWINICNMPYWNVRDYFGIYIYKPCNMTDMITLYYTQNSNTLEDFTLAQSPWVSRNFCARLSHRKWHHKLDQMAPNSINNHQNGLYITLFCHSWENLPKFPSLYLFKITLKFW